MRDYATPYADADEQAPEGMSNTSTGMTLVFGAHREKRAEALLKRQWRARGRVTRIRHQCRPPHAGADVSAEGRRESCSARIRHLSVLSFYRRRRAQPCPEEENRRAGGATSSNTLRGTIGSAWKAAPPRASPNTVGMAKRF